MTAATDGLTVAYTGNFQPSHSTETHIAAALESLGHRVIRIQENETPWRVRVEKALGADLFLLTDTWRQDWPGGLAALHLLRKAGVRSASWHLDLFLGLDRDHLVTLENPFWATDAVFTADGDPVHAARLVELGITTHRWMPPAVHEAECYIDRPVAGYPEIAFVGAHTNYHAEHWPARKAMLDAMAARYGDRFALYPQGPAVRGADLNRLYASTKVIVGDSCYLPGLERYWSDRIPETIGRGGVLVHPDIPGLSALFVDGEHMLTYPRENWDALFECVDRLLGDTALREGIRRLGNAHVRDHHTYKRRAEAVLGHLALRQETLFA